jgi:hypothetical protein
MSPFFRRLFFAWTPSPRQREGGVYIISKQLKLPFLIRALKRCHEENPLYKQFFGVCNQLDWAMRDCTKVIPASLAYFLYSYTIFIMK